LLPKPALYSSFLAVFYVCKIRFNMTDVTFTNTFEWVIHTLIQLYGLSITIAACVTNSINTAASGTLCIHAPLPTGCRINPDLFGECDPVLERTTSKFRIASNAVIFLSFSVSAMSLIWICLHTYRVLKIASPSRGEASPNSSIPRLSDSTAPDTTSTTPRSDLAYNKNTLEKWDDLKKETVRQAIFFIATYLFIYTPLITYRFMHNKGSALGFIVTSMYPLHGLLTVFVYTHPKVASLRRIDPSVSWSRAFRLVLMAGGEIPKKPNPNSSSQDNETPQIMKRKGSSHHDNELGRFVNGDWIISSFSALLSTNGAVAGSDSHSYPFRDHKLDKIPENQMISSGLIADVSSPAPEEIEFDASKV
jgi:hypothetical protein